VSGLRPEHSRALAIGSNLAADARAAEVVGAFEHRGIRSILLRGPAIARWLYDEGERTYCDVDLVVEPPAVEAAEAVLAELGFLGRPLRRRASEPPRHAESWARGGGPAIDLHRRLVGVDCPDDELWDALLEHTEPLTVHGCELQTLDHTALLLVITLHAAQHGFEAARRDLAVALGRVTPGDWQQAADLAARTRAVAAFEAGLRTLPAGGEVADRLRLAAAPSPETLLRARVAPDLALGLNWAADLSARARARFLLSKLFPSPDEMRSRSALARRGLLGLTTAYARRTMWAAVKLPRAVRAVSSARRRSLR
jgi:hypothetical protein